LCVLFFFYPQIDFGLWNPEQKQVTKEKVGSKILAVAWSPDGLTLAVGMQSGVISLRNQQGEETYRIERRAPIWCIVFIPGTGGAIAPQQPSVAKGGAGALSNGAPVAGVDGDVLAVGCWDKTLSMYRCVVSTSNVECRNNLSHILWKFDRVDLHLCSQIYAGCREIPTA
jgi:WD40 repeat protein